MRIAGDIPHAHLKITIFQMNNRYSVKLENGEEEQTYKFREGQIDSVGDVKKFVDKTFIQECIQLFEKMTKNKMERFLNYGSVDDEFPQII